MKARFETILKELQNHAPFTMFGAFTGIVCMLIFKNVKHDTAMKMFYVFHPTHVLLSAIVTAAMFELYSRRKKFIYVLLVGFFGSIGIATLSDSVVPFVGEVLLGMHVEVHAHGHSEEDLAGETHTPADVNDSDGESLLERAHIGFIEGWYIVLPAALIGIIIAYFKPKTKLPHASHVLLSTWASSFHMIMAMAGQMTAFKLIGSFLFLFLAVWLPCCISDIVFPLLFVGKSCCHHCEH